jgi:hypothetical protein
MKSKEGSPHAVRQSHHKVLLSDAKRSKSWIIRNYEIIVAFEVEEMSMEEMPEIFWPHS